MTIISNLVLAGFLTFVPVYAAWTDNWASIQKAAVEVKSIEADFTQTKQLPFLKKPIVSKGRFYYRAPGELRWEYRSPVQSVVIMNSKGVRRYVLSEGRWVADPSAKLKPVQAVLGEMGGWMRGEFKNSKMFTPSLESKPEPHVVLVPKDAAFKKYVSRVVLELDEKPGFVAALRISEGTDASTAIVFEAVKLNQPLKAQVFAPPK